jgi:hypothetical protein
MEREVKRQTAKGITPFNACKYLKSKGWSLVEDNPRDDLYLFNHKKYHPKQIIIPKTNDYELFPDDILVAVSRLEEIEQRNSASILSQMLNPDADILRYRIQSPQAEKGTLSLSVADRFIKSVITSLKASVCDVFSKQLQHATLGNKKVSRLLERAQFGQTEVGSFVVKIVAPLDNLESAGESFTEMNDSGIRAGIVHLMTSANTLVNTVESGNIKEFIRKGLKEPPFSTNLVHSLVEMQLWEDATVEISSELTPLLPVNKPVPSKVVISPEYFADIEKIAFGFTPSQKECRSDYYIGFVSELCGETDEQGVKFGEVIIQVTTRDGDTFPVSANLPAEQHKTAIRCYENNYPVTFSGKIIRKGGRRREVVDISHFNVCEDDIDTPMKQNSKPRQFASTS